MKDKRKNIRQLIQWDDELGMMKNISELLQEIRDKKEKKENSRK